MLRFLWKTGRRGETPKKCEVVVGESQVSKMEKS